ncbi:DUF6624 domain-containing protein [Stenotrophomonas sp.]|uniref:DUF6624 domain-containing protein n=1 Tax=Stenotrophomonas sp. TaxID=69392 RepID=UPI0028ACA00A|nr:DUF6624 domain-containing protein [Stenotrophomonas sp.]
MLRTMLVIGLMGWVGSACATEEDPALAAALLKCPRAAAFIDAAKRHKADELAPAEVVPSEPALREQLLEMARIDQDARSGEWSPQMIEKMLAVDAANLPQIRKIAAEHDGLPAVSQVGADGLSAAWLLVQHADRDVDFQRGVLERIMPLVGRGEVSSREYALLTDRVLVNSNRPQRYGSQLLAVGGEWQPRPMEAPDQVDQRRAAVGEMPLADYICVATQLMSPPSSEGGER